MLSLKKYMSAAGDHQTLLRVMSLILDGIALHTIEHDPEEHRAFQNTIRRLQQELVEEDDSQGGMLVTAGALIQTFEQHNRCVHREFLGQGKELRDMVELLTEVLRRTCHGNQRTVSTLGDIEKQLRGASQIDDLRVLKSKLGTCLASVQTEVARQVAEGGDTRAVLENASAPRSSKPAAAEESGSDSVTGLPKRHEGRAHLEKVSKSEGAFYSVILSLDRLSTVKSRFGVKACEAYILMASQSIAQRLGDRDQLFHWGAHAFLAVLERTSSLENVQSEVTKIGSAQKHQTITVGERTVLIPISISSLCLPVWEAQDADALVERIDAFVLKVAS